MSDAYVDHNTPNPQAVAAPLDDMSDAQTATAAALVYFDVDDVPVPHLGTNAKTDAAVELLCRARDGLIPAIATPADTMEDLCAKLAWRIIDAYDGERRWPTDPVFLSILGDVRRHAHPALVARLRKSARHKSTPIGLKLGLGPAPRAVVKALAA